MRKRRRDQLLQLLRVRDRAGNEAGADVAVLSCTPPTSHKSKVSTLSTPTRAPNTQISGKNAHLILMNQHLLPHRIPALVHGQALAGLEEVHGALPEELEEGEGEFEDV